LKFDTHLESEEPSINDFDVWIYVNAGTRGIEELGNAGVTIRYNYSDDLVVYDIKNAIYINNNGLQNFVGKKITAIGFNSKFNNSVLYPDSAKMCAVLDTSNYNIIINEGERLLIVRKDIIQSDAEMITEFQDIVKSPVHLRPYGLREIESTNPDENINPDGKTYTIKGFANAYLESIGLGFNNKKIYKNVSVIQKNKEGESIVIIGKNDEYLKLHNLPNFLIYPGNNIFPSNKLYPINKRYSYLFFNYRIFQMEYIYSLETSEQLDEETVDTGYTYSMVVPLHIKDGNYLPLIYYESEGNR
jgi:hypothetical protein